MQLVAVLLLLLQLVGLHAPSNASWATCCCCDPCTGWHCCSGCGKRACSSEKCATQTNGNRRAVGNSNWQNLLWVIKYAHNAAPRHRCSVIGSYHKTIILFRFWPELRELKPAQVPDFQAELS